MWACLIAFIQPLTEINDNILDSSKKWHKLAELVLQQEEVWLTWMAMTFTFLADNASFLAGGGDMVLVASDVMLLRAGGFIFAVFCSSVLWERSMLLAGDARPLEPLRGVEGVSPTGALLGPTESWPT